MRRIDIILIGLGVFLLGGGLFLGFKLIGFDDIDAGRWSQLIFILGLLGWVSTYLIRVNGRKMTYHQQLENYETAVLEKRLEELSPEELEALQQELEAESNASESSI
jgi:hypothetical protein